MSRLALFLTCVNSSDLPQALALFKSKRTAAGQCFLVSKGKNGARVVVISQMGENWISILHRVLVMLCLKNIISFIIYIRTFDTLPN